jgi:HK97 gp10 family phage protein
MSKSTVYGADELAYLFEQMSKDFGVPSAEKNVMIPAAREAMKIVLQAAKSNLTPGHGYDTGQLQRTLAVHARVTNRKDRRSKYVDPGDVVISTVSALVSGKDVSDGRAMFVEHGTKNKAKLSPKESASLSSKAQNARERELGTVRMAARPYLRPALELTREAVVDKFASEIEKQIAKYKAKEAKRNKG